MTANVQTSILAEVQAERQRQITEKGFTRQHDLAHNEGQLATAAVAYTLAAAGYTGVKAYWPWDDEDFNFTTPRRALVKAAALIVAEIERIGSALNIEGQASESFADLVEHYQENGGLVELGSVQAPEPELTADFTRVLPGGVMDDSTFSAVETALDRAEAPSTEGDRWLTLVERVEALAAMAGQGSSPA